MSVIPYGSPAVDSAGRWRLLIKGLGGNNDGSVGNAGPHYLTFNAATQIWSRTNAGIISYAYDLAHQPHPASGTYLVNPIVVPFDPIHTTGGSFWELKEGPNVGWLVSFWTNDLGYGDITVTSQGAAFGRGPGDTLATLEFPTAHSVGAEIKYNEAGSMHLTLLVDDPNIRVIVPKQTHYAIEFYDTNTDTWHEVYAGVIWDIDATETSVIFYGIDYLALLSTVIDERFNLKTPNKAAPTGSYYIKKTISEIVTAELEYAVGLDNSWVNFIKVGSIGTMSENVSIYSSFHDVLSFCVGMLNSHRAGTGKNTRLYVQKNEDGSYQFNVDENPGSQLVNVPLSYGALINGYRIVKFGSDWASRANALVQDIKGVKTQIISDDSAVDQSVWGRIGGSPKTIISVDTNDVKRRVHQQALDQSRLGRSVGVGLKLGSFRPMEGYNICDKLPLVIDHGAVYTPDWGSDRFGVAGGTDPSLVQAQYWTIYSVQFETYDDGHWITNFGLFPAGGGPMGAPCSSTATAMGYFPPNNNSRSDPVVYYSVPGEGWWHYGHFNIDPRTEWGATHAPRNPAGKVDFGRTGCENGLNLTFHGNGTATVYLWSSGWGDSPPPYGVDITTVHYVGETDVIDSSTLFGADVKVGTAMQYRAIEIPLTLATEGNCKQGIHIGFNYDGWGGGSWNGNIGFDGVEWEPSLLASDGLPTDPLVETHRTPFGAGNGAPPTGLNPTNVDTYVDRTTGQAYKWDDTTETWTATGDPGPTIKDWPLADVLTAGNTGGSKQVKSIADPTDAQDAATKHYVDAHVVDSWGDLDGGAPGSTYGGVSPINCGGVS